MQSVLGSILQRSEYVFEYMGSKGGHRIEIPEKIRDHVNLSEDGEGGESTYKPLTISYKSKQGLKLNFTCPPGFKYIYEKLDSNTGHREFLCQVDPENPKSGPSYKGRYLKSWPAEVGVIKQHAFDACKGKEESMRRIMVCYPIMERHIRDPNLMRKALNAGAVPMACYPVPTDPNAASDSVAPLLNDESPTATGSEIKPFKVANDPGEKVPTRLGAADDDTGRTAGPVAAGSKEANAAIAEKNNGPPIGLFLAESSAAEKIPKRLADDSNPAVGAGGENATTSLIEGNSSSSTASTPVAMLQVSEPEKLEPLIQRLESFDSKYPDGGINLTSLSDELQDNLNKLKNLSGNDLDRSNLSGKVMKNTVQNTVENPEDTYDYHKSTEKILKDLEAKHAKIFQIPKRSVFYEFYEFI